MHKDLVSIIVPVYNGEAYIAHLIERLLNNPYKNMEILIGDDASTDKTREILRGYAWNPKIKIYFSPVNKGAGAVRNKLLKMATGEFIALQDVDDSFAEDRFVKQVEYLNSHSNVGAVGTNATLQDKASGKIWGKIRRRSSPGLLDWLIQASVVHASMMIRSSELKDSLYQENLCLGEDYYFLTELYFKKVIFKNIPEPLYYYHIDESDLRVRAYTRFDDMVRSIVIISGVVPSLYRRLFVVVNFLKLSLGFVRGWWRSK